MVGSRPPGPRGKTPVEGWADASRLEFRFHKVTPHARWVLKLEDPGRPGQVLHEFSHSQSGPLPGIGAPALVLAMGTVKLCCDGQFGSSSACTVSLTGTVRPGSSGEPTEAVSVSFAGHTCTSSVSKLDHAVSTVMPRAVSGELGNWWARVSDAEKEDRVEADSSVVMATFDQVRAGLSGLMARGCVPNVLPCARHLCALPAPCLTCMSHRSPWGLRRMFKAANGHGYIRWGDTDVAGSFFELLLRAGVTFSQVRSLLWALQCSTLIMTPLPP